MARETKVGMLVGLGFIVCFAIILENRGRRDPVGPQMPHEVLNRAYGTGEEVTPTVAERRARDYGRSTAPVPVRRADPSSRKAVRPPAQSETTSAESAQSSPQADASAKSPKPAGQQPTPTPNPRRFAERRAIPAVQPAQSAAALPRAESAPETVVDTEAALTATASAASAEPPSPPARRYRIKKGDTLSRIAREQYGSRSRRIIDGLFNANRSVLSSPDQVRPDQEIVLPVIEGLRPSAVSAPENTEAEPKPPPKPKQRYRYYQVKKGDRYVTIAREQLGSAAKWKEIAELNADIFPDPAKIRHGVRIRLPAEATAPSQRQPS